MILNGIEIKKLVGEGTLGINPVEFVQYRQNGVDLILEDMSLLSSSNPYTDDYVGPGEYYLASTREVLTLPDYLMGFIELRSTWMRKGFMISPTVVDAGFSGNLTIGVFSAGYTGPYPRGERFFHLVFDPMLNSGTSYRGKYFGQRGITGAKGDA